MTLKDRIYRWYTEWRTPAHRGHAAPVVAGPLATHRVALVTTAGVRLREQPPFDTEHGDPSWRRIPGNVAIDSLVVDHTHYDTAPANADLDCVFPLRTLQALQHEGIIGEVAPVHFGYMGYIPDTAPLVNEFAPAMARELRAAGVSAVLLSPG